MPPNSDELKRELGIDGDGAYRVEPQTGRVEKEGFCGWKDTDERIDLETGEPRVRGSFDWQDK